VKGEPFEHEGRLVHGRQDLVTPVGRPGAAVPRPRGAPDATVRAPRPDRHLGIRESRSRGRAQVASRDALLVRRRTTTVWLPTTPTARESSALPCTTLMYGREPRSGVGERVPGPEHRGAAEPGGTQIWSVEGWRSPRSRRAKDCRSCRCAVVCRPSSRGVMCGARGRRRLARGQK
jgi:hypothetical protein